MISEPTGECAAITPWNAPLVLLYYKVAAGPAAGLHLRRQAVTVNADQRDLDQAAAPARHASIEVAMRYAGMTDTIDDLLSAMDAAAKALDFEEARRLRDRINLIRGGASAKAAAEADTSGLVRQRPGAMGLGTSRQRPPPPPGWKPPPKPDPMTSGRKRK